MNRKQRRAAAKRGLKVDQFRRLSERMVDAKPLAEFDPSRRALPARIRPLKVSDMAPGYAYRPDLIMFEIELPAVPGQMGAVWQMPVWVPEQFREPTVENTRAVYAWVYSTDPEARAIIDDMRARARPWSESQAAFTGPREYLGRYWLPPSNPTPPDASAPTSTTRN